MQIAVPQPRTLSRWLAGHSQLLILMFVLISALGFRLYHVNEPPLNFHAVRQYHSMIIARGFYLGFLGADAPQWKETVAAVSAERQGVWEPPIIEFVNALGYLATGGEHAWLPKLISSLIWLVGGVFLFLIADRIADRIAAIFSLGFFTLAPFALVASRSFQPDPLMVSAFIVSIYMVLRFYEQPSERRLIFAALVSVAAILVKSVALFPILGAFVVAGICTQNMRTPQTYARAAVFLSVSLLPSVIYYGYQIFVSESLRGVAEGNIMPHLILKPYFWRGWLLQIEHVVGYAALLAGLIGIQLFRTRLAFGLVAGLWAGYFAFGLVFTYTIHTHDYWNLILLPIVALSTGPVVSVVIRRLKELQPPWRAQVTILAIALLAMALSFGQARPRFIAPGAGQQVTTAEEIGQLVDHSTDVVYLAADYGLSLEYHGLVAGRPWPLASDFAWERMAGDSTIGAEERFNTIFAADTPRYFVVLDLNELEQQPDLKEFLTTNFRAVAETNRYLIFDLRKG